jgi:glutathione S-transferase
LATRPVSNRDFCFMSIVVYQMAHSPFCIPITQALTCLGREFETREVPNWDRSEIIRLTDGDYYQVPVLVDGERLVYESRPDSQDVARYVDTVYAGGRLFPDEVEGPQQCVIEFLENEVEARGFKLADIHYVPAIEDLVARTMTIRHKERRFGRGCLDQWRAQASAIRYELDALLARFEATLRKQAFLFGDVPVYSDFLLYGVIGNFTFNGWNSLNAEQHGLVEWQGRLRGWKY